jgi:phosphonate metabolism protein (transferase hexapeptide repeat family)
MHNTSSFGSSSSAMLTEKPAIDPSAILQNVTLGKYNEIAADVKLMESQLGDYSYIMERSDIIYSHIGKFTNIASDVRINPGNHPLEWVSQHHFLYRLQHYGFADRDNESFFNWRRLQQVSIGHDVWIGHKAIVLPGIRIGNGAVIAAGAVVSRDVSPYAIVAGIPAKPLRKRFPRAIRQSLEEIAWWDWSYNTLKERLPDFYDIRRFIQLYGNHP